MSSRPSIHELLVKRNRRFLFSVILVIVFLFLVLQTIVLFHVHSSTQQFISNWLGKNQGRIEQALFLENSLGIQGVLGELEGLHDQAASIRVLRSDGRLAGESADKKVEGCFAQKAFSASGFEGFISHPLSRNLCYRGPLHFAERQYGWIEMSADYNLGSLLSNTLLCLVLSALVFMVVKRSATVLLRELNQSVVSPLSFFTGQMASQPTEIKDLSTLRRDAREFQFAPTEVLDLVDGYNGLIGKVHELSAKEAQRIELLSYSQVADQVSHDIRSPLAALNMVLKSLKDLPEEMRIILRSAAQRITDITNELQNQNKRVRASGSTIVQGSVSQGPVMLNALLDSIVSEKRTQFRENLEIEIQGEFEKGYGLFANINSTELARVVSNLINNSVESLIGMQMTGTPLGEKSNGNLGQVLVSIRSQANEVIITISDNGPGIPEAILSRLGERGVTYGKPQGVSGSGLGVYHAMQTIQGAGGKVIYKTGGLGPTGTAVTLILPRLSAPSWFAEEIVLSQGVTVVSVDDDQTIHQIWSGRLASLITRGFNQGPEVKHVAVTSAEVFEKWLSLNKDADSRFFVDYEFIGQSYTGLDLIERNQIGPWSILVTSRYEETHLRQRAESLGIKILPKSLAPMVPLRWV